ncbi:MAG: glycosyltransferase [Sedimentisphaerales bacterium]|jgi:glycosyltransferase involved in cell wall biosynthesis|nr:glycosyltransferase [Sedimentisphaerales bacterium]
MADDDRQELLILNRTQFGYHLDTYHYAKFGAKRLRITYMGFDTGRPRLALNGVLVKYVRYKGPKCLRYVRLLVACVREVRRCRGAAFINYFPGCSVLRCFGSRARMIVDIRTGSIHPKAPVRRWWNRLIRWESCWFRHVSVVSSGLAEHLGLCAGKVHILPLGAERMSIPAKRFDCLDLLYVGTLDGRRIEDTVIGLERFLCNGGRGVPLAYTIVGEGPKGQLDALRRLVRDRGLEGIVHLLGYVHRTRLNELFRRCSVGVAYVPINDIYDCQPVTKTFEYLFAGMPVIATATAENRKVVGRSNGVLIQDTPGDFCRGLKEVYDRRHRFDSETIRRCCAESSWDRIVDLNFVPYIQAICQLRHS